MQFSLDIVIYLLGLAALWGNMAARLKTLEKKREGDSNAINRLVDIEKQLKVHEEKYKVINHRLNELERRR